MLTAQNYNKLKGEIKSIINSDANLNRGSCHSVQNGVDCIAAWLQPYSSCFKINRTLRPKGKYRRIQYLDTDAIIFSKINHKQGTEEIKALRQELVTYIPSSNSFKGIYPQCPTSIGIKHPNPIQSNLHEVQKDKQWFSVDYYRQWCNQVQQHNNPTLLQGAMKSDFSRN